MNLWASIVAVGTNLISTLYYSSYNAVQLYTQHHNEYIAHLILLKVKMFVILLKSENYHWIDNIEILPNPKSHNYYIVPT